jgi:hypothetical protein
MPKPNRPSTDPELPKKRQLLGLARFVDERTDGRATPNDLLDVMWSCVIRDRHRGTLSVRAVRKALARRKDELMADVEHEHERLRELQFDAWHEETAARYGLTEPQFRAQLNAHGERWRDPAPRLPDDWALPERLALACVFPVVGSWNTPAAA